MALIAHVAWSIVEGFRALGLPAEAIARRAGLAPEGGRSPFAVLPDEVYLGLWREGLAAASGRSTLALEVGLGLPFGAAGPLDYLVASAPTVGASLRVLKEAFGFAASDIRLELDDSRREVLVVALVNAPPFEGSWWSDELICGLLLSRQRAAVTAAGAKVHLDLARPRPRDPARWSALTGGPVRFGRRRSALHLPRSILELPLRTADHHLAAALRALMGIPGERGPALVPALRGHLKGHLEATGESARATARALGVSLRTLQRQLKEQGLTFSGVLDEVRREHAELLLADEGLRVSEVAHRVGFVEQASFTRAFHRWTGMSPQAWRAAHTTTTPRAWRRRRGA